MVSFSDLDIDAAEVTAAIERSIRDAMKRLGRRGAVLGVSGGIDSAVCAALCTRALGTEQVLALLMPERDSSPDSLRLGRTLAANLAAAFVETGRRTIIICDGHLRAQERGVRAWRGQLADGP